MRTAKRIGLLAVAAVIGVAAISLTLAARSGDDTTTARPVDASGTTSAKAPGEEPAVFVARRFIDAYGDLDADRALGYLADDADFSGLVTSVGDQSAQGTVDDFRLLLSLLEAQRYEQLPGTRCRELGNSLETTQFLCTFAFHDIRSDELGLAPFTGSYFLLTVRGGEIVEASKTWATEDFSPQVWEPFAAWVRKRYPEDAAIMFTASMDGARLSEESVELWEKRTREYVKLETESPEAVKIAERFMVARDRHDAEKAMSLVADDGARVRLLWGYGLYPHMPILRMNRRKLSLALEAERIYGVRYRSVECRRYPVWGSEGEAEILCSYRMDSRLIGDRTPVRGSLGIGLRDGKVVYTSFPWLNVSFPSWVPAGEGAFAQWLQSEHPEAGGPFDRGTLFRTMGQELVLILTPRSLDLLERYLAAYESSVDG
jgi:hypothetical protein